MASFKFGNVITATVQFTNTAGTLVDPASVVWTVIDPNSVTTIYTYGSSSEATRTSTGVYVLTLQPDTPRRWNVRVAGTGSNKSAQEGNFDIEESLFD